MNEIYESPQFRAIEGDESEELLESVLSTCHTIYCPQGAEYVSGGTGSSCTPPTTSVYCNSSSSYCSVQYTF